MKKLGPLKRILDMLPKMGPMKGMPEVGEADERRLTRIEAIIDSMTPQERRNPRAPQRQPQAPDRQGLRHLGPGDQPADEAVPGDEEDDEEAKKGWLRRRSARRGTDSPPCG